MFSFKVILATTMAASYVAALPLLFGGSASKSSRVYETIKPEELDPWAVKMTNLLFDGDVRGNRGLQVRPEDPPAPIHVSSNNFGRQFYQEAFAPPGYRARSSIVQTIPASAYQPPPPPAPEELTNADLKDMPELERINDK